MLYSLRNLGIHVKHHWFSLDVWCVWLFACDIGVRDQFWQWFLVEVWLANCGVHWAPVVMYCDLLNYVQEGDGSSEQRIMALKRENDKNAARIGDLTKDVAR